jgi:hypothetical protein
MTFRRNVKSISIWAFAPEPAQAKSADRHEDGG